MTSSVTIELDSDLLEQASQVAEDNGTDLESITRELYQYMSQKKTIPVDPAYLEAVKEA